MSAQEQIQELHERLDNIESFFIDCLLCTLRPNPITNLKKMKEGIILQQLQRQEREYERRMGENL